MAQIVEYKMAAANPGQPVGLVEAGGLAVTAVSTSGTAANTDLAASTRYVTVKALDKYIGVDIGDGVTADSNSYQLAPGERESFAIPYPRNETWRVSIIDQ